MARFLYWLPIVLVWILAAIFSALFWRVVI